MAEGTEQAGRTRGNAKRIVLVEDNPGDAFLTCERLAEAPDAEVQVCVATSLAEARRLLEAGPVDAILLDLNLPDSQGLDTLRGVKPMAGQAPIIAVSGRIDAAMRSAALAEGAEDVFSKDEMNSRLFCRSVLFVVERNRARLQQCRLQGLLDATPDAIIVANADGKVRFVNTAAVALFGRPREDLFGEWLSFSAAPGEPTQISVPRPDGVHLCEMRVAQLEWDGAPAQLASIRDMTESAQAEMLRLRSSELELQNQRMQEANRLKTEFLANMSHEIRTPMNAIIGMSHLLDKTRLNGEQRAFLAKIQIASHSLLGVINDVLDLSKIEAGEVVLEDLPFDLPKLLRELGQMLQSQAQAKGIDLAVHPSASVARRVQGDVTRVRQILTNLLGNALKFTERGQVELTVSNTTLADDLPALRFDIRDTGIGIAPDDLKRLFLPFTQADASTTRRFGGTGLGLSIVQQLTQLMGGTVQVASQPGVGSVFSVCLPLPPVSDQRDGAEGSPQALHVLVSGTSKLLVQRLRSIARSLGWHLESVELHMASLPLLAERLALGPTPDAWVVGVEEGSGALGRAMAKLRELLGPDRWPACVALGEAATAVAPFETLADAWQRHPLSTTRLFDAVMAAMRKRQLPHDRLMQLTPLDAVGVRWLCGVHVMVVDDSEINLEVARRILEREGAQVDAFADAPSLLSALRQAPQGADAVLMDVQMPGMDGNAATRAIRDELGLASLPVIGLSAGAFVSERNRAIESGMVDFLTKPLDPDSLIRTVHRHVEHVRGEPLAIEHRSRRRRSSLQAWPQIEGIDGREVAKRLGDDVSLFAVMLGSLLREFGPNGPSCTALDLNEATHRQIFAGRMHKLRGSAGMLGASTLQRLAGEADALARRSSSQAQLERAREAVNEQLNRLAALARPLLDAQAAARASAALAPVAAPIRPGELEPLVGMLQAQEFAAVHTFTALEPQLRQALGSQAVDELRMAVDRLEFSRAVAPLWTLLRELRASSEIGHAAAGDLLRRPQRVPA